MTGPTGGSRLSFPRGFRLTVAASAARQLSTPAGLVVTGAWTRTTGIA